MTNYDIDPRRIEELLLLCTAPKDQLAYEGWLVRRARNDVKRASSVNAFYSSSKPLQEKIDHVERLYSEYGMPPLFRLTSFSRPFNLDEALEQRGYERFETSLVMVSSLDASAPPLPEGLRFRQTALERFVEDAGTLRGRTPEQRRAEYERLREGEVPGYCVIAYLGDEPVACGLVMLEEEFAGLFDVFTAEQHRGRGIGTATTAHLLQLAKRMGRERGWLSVVAENQPALKLYRKLGFEPLYEYWYRRPKQP
jgi:N-acetylglutamate synthase